MISRLLLHVLQTMNVGERRLSTLISVEEEKEREEYGWGTTFFSPQLGHPACFILLEIKPFFSFVVVLNSMGGAQIT